MEKTLGGIGLMLILAQVMGCFPCGLAGRSLLLRAVVLNAEALGIPEDVLRIRALTLTEGQTTGGGGGLFDVVPSLEDGIVELRLGSSDRATVCGLTADALSDLPPYPAPDEILVIIEREACEQRFTIEINEDTVVDLSFPDFTIELKDPILLPPCEEVSGN